MPYQTGQQHPNIRWRLGKHLGEKIHERKAIASNVTYCISDEVNGRWPVFVATTLALDSALQASYLGYKLSEYVRNW